MTDLQARKRPGTAARIPSTGQDWARRLRSVFQQHEQRFSQHAMLQLEDEECRSVLLVLDGWLSLSKSLPDG